MLAAKTKLNATFLVIASSLFLLLVVSILLPHRAAAATDEFPGNSLSPGSTVAWQGTHAAIDARYAYFEVAVPASSTGTVDIRIRLACDGSRTAGTPGMQATVPYPGGQTKTSNSAADCSGQDFVFNNVNMGPTEAKYQHKLRTITIRTEKINGEGHQPFLVRATASGPVTVSFADDPNRTSVGFGGSEQGRPVGLWGQSRMTFQFKPSCDFNEGETAYVKWLDADDADLGLDASWELRETNPVTGQTLTIEARSPGEIGGNGSPRSVGFTPHAGYTYTWIWYEVGGNNALAVKVPWSENTVKLGINCDIDPVGDIGAVTCNRIKGWTWDANTSAALQYRLRITAADGSAHTFTGTANTGDYRPGHGFNALVPNLDNYFGNGSGSVTIRLDARNVDTNGGVAAGYTNNLSTRTVSRNCSGTDVPPTASISGNCTGVSVTGIGDDNEDGQGVKVTVRAYHGTPNNLGPGGFPNNFVILYDGRATGNLSFGTPTEDSVNNGWTFDVSYDNVQPNGSDSPAFDSRNKHAITPATGACYVASCTITVTPTVAGTTNGVKGGQQFTVTVTIYNNHPYMPLPGSVNGGANPLSGTIYPGANWGHEGKYPVSGTPIAPGGGAGSVAFNLTAPNDSIRTITVEAYVDFWGLMPISADCPDVSLNVYKNFILTPEVTYLSNSDTENPQLINYNSRIVQTLMPAEHASAGINATSSRTLYWTRNNVRQGDLQGPTNDNRQFLGAAYADTYTETDPTRRLGAGDQYCAVITITKGTGWIGPGGDEKEIAPGSSEPPSSCVRIVNKPYLKVYGADVKAGGGFGASCTDVSPIETFTRPVAEFGTRSGSGTQLAAFGSGQINGFSSAAMRALSPLPPKELSFANNANATGLVTGNENRPRLGGEFGGTTNMCMSNFFTNSQLASTDPRRLTSTVANLSTNALADDRQTIVTPSGGTLTISGNGSFVGRHALFVDGDVFISSNISYQGSANPVWTDINAITNFSLIVRGNIYISQDVRTLDGLYVAQPHPTVPNSGKIYTCTSRSGGARFATTQLWGECGGGNPANGQLKVTGTFAADQIFFLRTPYSISDSRSREPNDAANKAAEIFQVSPELMLSQPVFRQKGGPTTGEYDYITTLPPVL